MKQQQDEASATEVQRSLLDDVLERTPAAAALTAAAAPLIGMCVAAEHDTLLGRCRVEWSAHGADHAAWVPLLQGVVVRPGDRVLLQQPQNWPEPIVTGILDGLLDRPAPARPAATIHLQPDEAVIIAGADGRPLLEVRQGVTGPDVRLLQDGLELDINGPLRISADSVELSAERGGVQISASDDVAVTGEIIRLN